MGKSWRTAMASQERKRDGGARADIAPSQLPLFGMFKSSVQLLTGRKDSTFPRGDAELKKG
jgi:hypothetical protein